MPNALALALALALLALGVALGAAVIQPRWLPEPVAATVGALLLLALGVISFAGLRHALAALGPTVGFLAALLILAEGCRREGVFAFIGHWMAAGSSGRAGRLLGLTFVAAALVTAVLGLDATVVLLTPAVFVTATRLRTAPKPHAYACTHLANSASLLLVVSNLTNLLAFHASRLSFAHFAALMAIPWFVAIGVEWLAFRWFFASELVAGGPGPGEPLRVEPGGVPRFAVVVLGLTLLGFALSSVVGVAPVWFAAAGAAVLSFRELLRRRLSLPALARTAEPGFLIFVLGLGVIVSAAGDHGLRTAVTAVLPGGASLPDLLGIAAVSAVLANLVNNLPATLILIPVTAGLGIGPVLATLVGVNLGPNLSYAGSLATLLWRRVLRAEEAEIGLSEFTRLGLLTVPAGLVLCTFAVWVSVRGWG